METVLTIAVFVFLIVIYNNQTTKFKELEKNLSDLNKRLDILRKQGQLIEKPTIDSEEKTAVSPIPIIKPISTEIKPPEEKAEPIIIKEHPTAEKEVQAPEVISVEKPMPKVAEAINVPKPIIPKQEIPKVILPPKKSWWETFKDNNPDLEKFIGENLINKIGILILALGISYLVKLGIDQNVITEPMRVGIGILAGSIVMIFAHKLRANFKPFSSVLVAGAISIFYFTIAIAFHDYHLINQTMAFVIMVIITLFSTFISISYDRMELAALSLIGAFAVPFMVSTGSGNYVVLLTYIAIIDIGILMIAYYKKWNFLNIQAYVFTMLLYCSWLSTIIGEVKAPYLGALIFGFVFYFIFILTNIINNLKNKGEFSKIQLMILSSNTLIYYACGMIILENYHPELKGLFTTLLALFNLIYAWFLYKKFGVEKTVIYVLIGMTLTFATLAIPIQFKGNYITLFWAAEAVLLMWLSQKSQISHFRFASVIVHGMMLMSLLLDWTQIYGADKILNIIINPAFITGIFGLGSYLAVYFLIRKEDITATVFGISYNSKSYSQVVKIIIIFLGYIIGFIELSYQATIYIESYYAICYIKAVYHFIFSALFIYFAFRSQNKLSQNFASILATINSIAILFLTSHFAFSELEEYTSGNITFPLAYILHFIALILLGYFCYILYKTREKNYVFQQFNSNTILIFASLFLVYFASSELMLHVIAFSGGEISATDLQHYITTQKMSDLTIPQVKSYMGKIIIDDIENQVIKTGYPILWGSLAFMFLIIGIKRQVKNLRIIALILLGITILKLFIYDIRNASETGKIIAFILLGVLILIISFVYQKLKVLVLSTPEEQKTNNEND